MAKSRNKSKNKRKRKIFIGSAIILFAIIMYNTSFNLKEQINLVFSNINDEDSENKKVIVIDIGHGGNDQGTQSTNGKLIEKDINLQIGKKVIEILKKDSSVEIVETRSNNEYLSLSDRVEISNNNNSDLFVSLHCNADYNGTSSINGVETFYWKEDNGNSYELANEIQSSIVNTLEVRDRGVKQDDYAVIKSTNCPAVLVEMGFLTNNIEGNNLANNEYQTIMAESIAKGIINYILN